MNGKLISLYIRDTFGEERLRDCEYELSSNVHRSHGIMLVYDVTDRDSYLRIEDRWLRNFKNFEAKDKILVGNKIDLAERRAVDYNEAKEFADSRGEARSFN